MIDAYAISDVRAAEAVTLETLDDGELMQRAARALAEIAGARAEAQDAGALVALVGSGDNGADAVWAAAFLADAQRNVAVVLADVDREQASASLPPALEAAIAAGVTVIEAPAEAGVALTDACAVVAEADLVLDGLLGIGGRPGLRTPAAELVDAIADSAYVIAVDCPSGLDPEGLAAASAENSSGTAVFADETVTFGAVKPVHLVPPGDLATGRLTIVDIGIDVAAEPTVQRLTFDEVPGLWPIPGPDSDKYSRGVLGLITGSPTYPGAAVLSTLGAVGVGTGMVRYLGSERDLVVLAAPEAVMTPGRVQAYALGCGFDEDWLVSDQASARHTRELLQSAFESDLPVLVDAGALPTYADGWRGRTAPTVLTPHAGEAAALLTRLGVPTDRAQVTREPLATAQALTEATGAIVVLKGATTLISAPGRPTRSQSDGPAWLATAGTGDVLAGVIGALLASGLDAPDAAALGVLVHGVAGSNANPGGPVRPPHLAAALPATVAQLLA